MSEADEIVWDLENNLIPLVMKFMKTHADRWMAGDRESGKQLKTFHRSIVQHIHSKQPMPVNGDSDD